MWEDCIICAWYVILIKVKVKVNFTLEQATKAQRGSRGITTLSLTSSLDRGGWATPLYSRERPVPIV